MLLNKGSRYVVMGLLNTDSIAYAIGSLIERLGGKVIYTVQSERMKRIFFDRSPDLTEEEKAKMDIRFCDVTRPDEVMELFNGIGNLDGLVHSIAFANPKTCLGEDFHTNALDDIKQAFHISAVSLATVVQYAQPHMAHGGSVLALTFESRFAFPYYNWMGVNKAALEATVRALARRHGRDLVRVNAVSSGPVATKAAKSIPHFAFLGRTWRMTSPLPWDPTGEKDEVANAAAFLLGPLSRKITGQILHVDGGASIIGGQLLPHERNFLDEEEA